MTREQFIERQKEALDQLFAFTIGEDERRQRFEELALDTYDFLVANGVTAYFGLGSSGNFLTQSYRNLDVPPLLLRRWQDWKHEYDALLANNPRLALREAMHSISESHNASSWPDGYEGRIQDWVDAGDATAKPPFDDRYGIVTIEFYQKLRDLRRRCGGWLYWNDKLRRVVYASEPEWQRVRAEQDAARAARKKVWDDAMARSARLGARLATVMTAARNDSAFWEALKSWELAREAQRPAAVPTLQPMVLSGPLTLDGEHQRIVDVSSEGRNQFDNPPIDPIFADFIARIRVPDDAATVGNIVLELRAAVRTELGLDGFIVWKGGPGIG